MKKLFRASAVARPKTSTAGACVLLLVFLLLPGHANAQAGDKPQPPKGLYNRIAELDAALFAAYNKCDIDSVGTFFAEDLEFYHEKGGLTLSRDATLALMRKNLCGADSNRVRRELVEGSMEVRPINNYGAVQTGEHRFHLTQKGQAEKPDGIGKFVMLWREKDGEWKISRVISYGFRAP
jgi:ketosteroid isomerase-like protein